MVTLKSDGHVNVQWLVPKTDGLVSCWTPMSEVHTKSLMMLKNVKFVMSRDVDVNIFVTSIFRYNNVRRTTKSLVIRTVLSLG